MGPKTGHKWPSGADNARNRRLHAVILMGAYCPPNSGMWALEREHHICAAYPLGRHLPTPYTKPLIAQLSS
jgi:hypothetical protein